MKFVENHLKWFHFKKNPHKWLLAFLASPIHLAEMHYKKKYHLQFAHARKLFIFDIILLLSSITILVAGLFWWFYNPTITDLVYLSIERTPARILSGERLDFAVSYKNESEVTLVSPKLNLHLPAGYVLEETKPQENFDKENSFFQLKNLPPGEQGTVHILGRIYETPHLETNISASLTYKQEGKEKEEKKITPFIAVLHGSVLQSSLTIEEKILSRGAEDFSFELHNKGDIEIKEIKLPLDLPDGINILDAKASQGEFTNNLWYIAKLEANKSAVLKGQLNFNLKNTINTLQIKFTPEILINDRNIPQETLTKNLQVLHPSVSATSNWENNIKQLRPGENNNIYFDIKNDGDSTLKNLQMILPIAENIIDINKLTSDNSLSIKNKIASINILAELKPGQSTQLKLTIPIKNYPSGGTDLSLSLEPQIQATVQEVVSTYHTTFATDKIKIGTSLSTSAEIRYYTAEGDQLGRGPLPPQVGEETKYWALLQMTNGTSHLSNLQINATLPTYVKWTGKSSVSIGNDLSFDPLTRQISWTLNRLPANFTAGIYFEISLTPDISMLNTNPQMLKNIYLSVHDSFLDLDINKNLGNLDNSLKTDSIGKTKGSQIINF